MTKISFRSFPSNETKISASSGSVSSLLDIQPSAYLFYSIHLLDDVIHINIDIRIIHMKAPVFEILQYRQQTNRVIAGIFEIGMFCDRVLHRFRIGLPASKSAI